MFPVLVTESKVGMSGEFIITAPEVGWKPGVCMLETSFPCFILCSVFLDVNCRVLYK